MGPARSRRGLAIHSSRSRFAVGFNPGVGGAEIRMAKLKITSVPPGEAPDWVRQHWVGLALPLPDGCEAPVTLPTFGVLSAPKTRIGQSLARFFGRARTETGYLVESLPAFDLLAQSSREAADWWRAHTPELAQPGQYLLFQIGVGHVQPSDASEQSIQAESVPQASLTRA